MKKIITTLFSTLLITIVIAQTPNAFKYQAVVRDASGNAIVSSNVDFQISILESSASGSSVFVETFSTTTNQFGLVNLEIGTGTLVSGNFALMDLANDLYFVKVEVDINDGNGLQDMGTSQLLSVPYALNAKSAENVSLSGDVNGYANTNTVQKIQGLDVSTNTPADGQVLKWDAVSSAWIPNDDALGAAGSADGVVDSMAITGTSIKTITLYRTNSLGDVIASFTDSVNDADSDTTNEIQDLNLSSNTLTITNNGSATNIDLSGYSNLWQENGNDIYYDNGYVGVGINDPNGKLIVQGDNSIHEDTAIFEVKNKNGRTVFAVYEEGVRVYVDDNGTKANSSKGGFAVGGFSAAKGLTNEYFRVTPDSVRVYIESAANSSKGGFAVGGYSATKTIPTPVFNVGASANANIINPSDARIAWYPLKEAFLAGRVLVEHPDSVGLNSFSTGYISRAKGDYSQAFGYQSIARGDYSTAIGRNAIAENINSFALGEGALASGDQSYSIGRNAVASSTSAFAIGTEAKAIGSGSFAIGSGYSSYFTEATGDQAFAIGFGAQATNTYSLALGLRSIASGAYSTAIGPWAESTGYRSTSIGYETIASGDYSVATGNQTTASGENSFAACFVTDASGSSSAAFGYRCTSSGYGSFSTGQYSKATRLMAVAIGGYTTAEGYYSFATGNNTKSKARSLFVLGEYNDTTVNYSYSYANWYTPDPLFIIGNGTSNTARSNAMKVLKDGRVYFPDVYGDNIGASIALYMNSNGQIGTVQSARRYKKEINNMENIDWLYKLRPVNYIYKTDKKSIKQYGLIAEEVESINPLFVNYNKEGKIETVAYNQFITPMLKAMQDLKKENEILKAEIAEIKALLKK